MLPAGKTVAAKAAPLLGTGSIPNRDPALPRDGWLEAWYLPLAGYNPCRFATRVQGCGFAASPRTPLALLASLALAPVGASRLVAVRQALGVVASPLSLMFRLSY